MESAKQFITVRVPPMWRDEVRRLADRESETQSTIIRRLLRLGLQSVRSQVPAVRGEQ